MSPVPPVPTSMVGILSLVVKVRVFGLLQLGSYKVVPYNKTRVSVILYIANYHRNITGDLRLAHLRHSRLEANAR